MKTYDFIVVGFGISGISMAYQLLSNKYSICVIDDNDTKASVVAAGMCNPVILKRFSLAWNAHEYLEYATVFYESLGEYLGITCLKDLPVLRNLSSIEEQNKWFTKQDNPILRNYMSSDLSTQKISGIDKEFHYGELKGTKRLNVSILNESFVDYLKKKDMFLEASFEVNKLSVYDDFVSYKNIKAQHIIFCEGIKVVNNSFFSNLGIIGNKGSYITIKCPELKLNKALKTHYFLIPMDEPDVYKFGATYQHQFSEKNYEEESKVHLVQELRTLLDLPFTVLEQQVAIRPTVKDRRPLIGTHKTFRNLHVLNGMGTRGVLMAPTMSRHLYDYIVNGIDIPQEVSIHRF